MNPPTIQNRLKELGIVLPAAPAPVGAYVGALRAGNLVVTSGQLPWRDGKMLHPGRLGEKVTVEQGFEAARQCAINGLAQVQAVLGDLENVKQVVRVEGYVHCGPGFREQPQVLNGASNLLNAIFDERGKHTRTALGIHEMPLDAPVQLVLWVEAK
jgi:enamine deaminase RidA (YjgF/YER057c/UK114 family)